MSSHATTQTTRGSGKRGRGGYKGRGGKRGAGKPQVVPPPDVDLATTTAQVKANTVAESKVVVSPADESEVCFICAEPVKYYSVSDCDHRTCHLCALRLRALYKKTECTFCKVRCLVRRFIWHHITS